MNASLNEVKLIGYLGADPEIRQLPDGKKVASFSVATSEGWTDKESGEKKQKTEWHKISVFNEPLIENVISKFLHKGSRVFLEGSLETTKVARQRLERAHVHRGSPSPVQRYPEHAGREAGK
jgi:single-strand DNA-binding protein